MSSPKVKKEPIKQFTWHEHYDDASSDIVFVSNDGVKFGMSLKLLGKSSTVFADMGPLPAPIAGQQKAEQLIDLAYDQSTVLQFLELVSIHNVDLIVPTFDFASCCSLTALAEQFDCFRLSSSLQDQLFTVTYDEEQAWELFKVGAKRNDWKIGRQALRGMYYNHVSALLGYSTTFGEILDTLPSAWQLALSSAVLSSSFDNRQLIMDWSGLASKFYEPGSAVDKEAASTEEKHLVTL